MPFSSAFAAASTQADVIITSGGVSGRGGFHQQMLNGMGEVLFWKIAMKPGRPMAVGKVGGRLFLRPAWQPGRGDRHLLPVRSRPRDTAGSTDYALPPT